MHTLKKKLHSAINFIRKLDREYFVQKYHQLRHLKRRDIMHFLKHSHRPIFYGVSGFVIVMLVIPIVTYVYFGRDLASKDTIMNKKNEGVVLFDRNEKPFFTLFDARTRNPIPLKDLQKHTSQAFIAIEDKDFYKHPGFSISGIGRAIRQNLLSESYAQGGSTISQQLMKNTILSPDKKLLRKYQELVLALEIERRYEKDDILEMYLNTTYFGEGAVGIQDAAHRYFSKDASELTLAESALLAGVIRSPSALSPISGDFKAALKRKDLILQLMKDQKFITEDQKIKAQKEKIKLNPTEKEINNEAVHFALMIQDMLTEEYGERDVANSGFVVKTTIDLDLQKKAQEAVAAQVERLAYSSVTNGAAVVIDPTTGEVLALVGSHDWDDEKNGRINMALRPRQPGSSFKPIIYAKALDGRLITTSTQLTDEEVEFGDYKPRNYDNKFRGKVLVRYALANSLNIPAVHVMNMVGITDGIKMARSLGITTLSDDVDYGLPLVLGAAEIPLIEMTNAYAVFADEGRWHEYSIFIEVRDKNGRVILENSPIERQALPDTVAYLISDILSDNKARKDVFGDSLTLSRKAAVKTGTTNDYRDALTIGYTPQVVVGVWIGNNDNTPMTSIAGSLGAAPIWRQIMEAYLAGKPVEVFEKPSGIVDEQVCREDGLKIKFATESAFLEYFIRGTVPTKECGIPTPTPTPDEEKLKQEEEEKKKQEEEEKKKNATPTPTNSQIPSPTQVLSPTATLTPTEIPISTPIITITLTEISPSITPP